MLIHKFENYRTIKQDGHVFPDVNGGLRKILIVVKIKVLNRSGMKKDYSPNLKKMPASSIFYALSDPARVEILLTLIEEKELSCGQCKTELSKSTMSHHFKVLRESGLIQRREEGKIHYISLRLEEIEDRMPGLIKLLKSMKKPL